MVGGASKEKDYAPRTIFVSLGSRRRPGRRNLPPGVPTADELREAGISGGTFSHRCPRAKELRERGIRRRNLPPGCPTGVPRERPTARSRGVRQPVAGGVRGASCRGARPCIARHATRPRRSSVAIVVAAARRQARHGDARLLGFPARAFELARPAPRPRSSRGRPGGSSAKNVPGRARLPARGRPTARSRGRPPARGRGRPRGILPGSPPLNRASRDVAPAVEPCGHHRHREARGAARDARLLGFPARAIGARPARCQPRSSWGRPGPLSPP